MTIVVTGADGKALGTLIGARGPEPVGDPNAKAFVAAVGSGIVYVVKPFVYDRIDKKRADFREKPRPTAVPGASPSPGAAPGIAPGADAEIDDDAGLMPDDEGEVDDDADFDADQE